MAKIMGPRTLRCLISRNNLMNPYFLFFLLKKLEKPCKKFSLRLDSEEWTCYMLGVIHHPYGLKFLLILGSIIIRSSKYGTPIMFSFRKQNINLAHYDVDRGNLHNIYKKTKDD